MIKIKTSEFREFLKRSRAIKDNGILPITSYFKLECDGDSSSLTKNAVSSFLKHEINATFKKNIVLLLDQKIASAFVNSTDEDEIKIEVKDNQVIYSDKEGKSKHPVVDHNEYPVMKNTDGASWFDMPKDMIESMAIARAYAANNKPENISWQDYVWIKPFDKDHSCVFATDLHIAYFKKFKCEMPVTILEKDICDVLVGYSNLQYAKIDQYHFFNSGNSTYGFCEIAVGFKNSSFEQAATKGDLKKISFSCKRDDIIKFCEIVNISSSYSALVPNCYIEEAGMKEVLFRWVDNDRNNGADRFIKVQEKKDQLQPFWFNPKQLVTFFKKLPYEDITFHQHDATTYFVSSDDKDYVGIIIGIAVGNQKASSSTESTTK